MLLQGKLAGGRARDMYPAEGWAVVTNDSSMFSRGILYVNTAPLSCLRGRIVPSSRVYGTTATESWEKKSRWFADYLPRSREFPNGAFSAPLATRTAHLSRALDKISRKRSRGCAGKGRLLLSPADWPMNCSAANASLDAEHNLRVETTKVKGWCLSTQRFLFKQGSRQTHLTRIRSIAWYLPVLNIFSKQVKCH